MPNLLYAQPEEVIAHVVNRIPGGLVILGDPGAGKTTFAQFLANSIANLGKDISACTISLRDFDNRRRSGSQSVAEYLSWIARERLQVHGSTDQWEMALSRGALVVIFDGLDELTDVRLRVEIADIIEAYVHAYPAAPAVVTCRIEGYLKASLDSQHFRILRLQSFDDQRIQDSVQNWFQLDGSAIDGMTPEESATSFLEESKEAGDLRSNPLLLYLLCILYRGYGFIPEHRADVYAQCAEMLFERWDSHRKVRVSRLTDRLRHLLEEIAWWMYSEGLNEVGVRERELLQRCSEELMDIKAGTPEAAERTAKEFVDHCRGRSWIFSDAGASDKEDRRFCFTHRTFLQYFAARKLARDLRSGRASNELIDLIPEDTGDPFQALLTLQVLGTEADEFLVNLLNVQDELVPSLSSFLAEIVRTVDLHDRTARVCCEVICEDIFQEAVLKADHLLEISSAVSLPDFVSSERLANLVTCREENLPGVLDALRTIYSEELQRFFTSSDVFPLVSIRDSAILGAETLTRERSDAYRELVDSLMTQLCDDIGHVTEDVSLAAAIVVAGLTPMGHVATRWGDQLLRLSLDPEQGEACLTVLFDSIINRAHFELLILPALAILQDCLASPMPLSFNRREAEAMLYGLDIGGQPHDVLSLGREDYRFDDQVGPATIASVLGVAVGLARELGTGYGLDWLKACASESFSEIELEEAIEINPNDTKVEAFDPWGSKASEAFHLALGRVRVKDLDALADNDSETEGDINVKKSGWAR